MDENEERKALKRIMQAVEDAGGPEGLRNRPRRKLHCSFCGKHQDEVRKLVAGPNVFICDECVNLCKSIMDEDLRGAPPANDPVRQ
jgi:hypothetical protein